LPGAGGCAYKADMDRSAPDVSDCLGLDVRQLLAFSAVAHCGSFRAAARHLGYVPSAISEQVAALERILGARLVARTRGSRTIALTDAGRRFLEHADAIIGRVARARRELRDGGRAGSETPPRLVHALATAALLEAASLVARADETRAAAYADAQAAAE
jgi:molybdate transport repressor ModE-like protein